MVRATLKRVKEIFRPEDKEQKENRPSLKRRLLLVVQLSDATYVLQGEQQIHQKNHCFRTEAIEIFYKAFTFVLRDDVHIGKVFQYDDVHIGKVFQREYVQWHVIRFDLAYCLDSTLLQCANLKGLMCQNIKDHSLSEQLKEYDQQP